MVRNGLTTADTLCDTTKLSKKRMVNNNNKISIVQFKNIYVGTEACMEEIWGVDVQTNMHEDKRPASHVLEVACCTGARHGSIW